MIQRREIADIIVARLLSEKHRMKTQYAESHSAIGYFYIDDLLPEDLALEIYGQFPDPSKMTLKKHCANLNISPHK